MSLEHTPGAGPHLDDLELGRQFADVAASVLRFVPVPFASTGEVRPTTQQPGDWPTLFWSVALTVSGALKAHPECGALYQGFTDQVHHRVSEHPEDFPVSTRHLTTALDSQDAFYPVAVEHPRHYFSDMLRGLIEATPAYLGASLARRLNADYMNELPDFAPLRASVAVFFGHAQHPGTASLSGVALSDTAHVIAERAPHHYGLTTDQLRVECAAPYLTGMVLLPGSGGERRDEVICLLQTSVRLRSSMFSHQGQTLPETITPILLRLDGELDRYADLLSQSAARSLDVYTDPLHRPRRLLDPSANMGLGPPL